MSTQKIQDYLKECDHFDPDNRYIAALDLCNEMKILSDQGSIDEALEKRICGKFIQHLSDKSLDVQTNAVRSIQKTAGILKENNLIDIVDKLTQMVIGAGSKDVRDVYSLAIRSTIQELNDQAAIRLIPPVLANLQKGLKEGKDEVKEECLDILGEIFRKFSVVLIKNQKLVNRDDLMRIISGMLQSQTKGIKKKSTQCIGHFAVILNQRQLDDLVKDLVNRLQKAQNKEEILTLLQSLQHITRQVGQKLTQNFQNFLSLLSGYAGKLNKNESIEIDNEIVESSLICIENLIRSCAEQAKDQVSQIFKLTSQFITYDPNYAGNDDEEDEQMQQEEDQGWGSDAQGDDDEQNDDDTAWKVRKSCVKIVDAITITCPNSLNQFWVMYIDLFSSRFSERDNNVKCDILDTFQNLLKASVFVEQYENNQINSQGGSPQINNKYEKIIKNLLKQLKQKEIKIKIATMKTLSVLSLVMKEQLEKHYSQIIPYIKSSADENNNDLITYSLQILRQAFKEIEPQKVSLTAKNQSNEIAQFLQKIIKLNGQSKIVSDALRVCGQFVVQLVDQNGKLNPQFNGIVILLFQDIYVILQEQNIAQEVKQSSIVAMAKIINVSYEALNQNQIDSIILIYGEKLNAELTRESALKGITLIAKNPAATIKIQGLQKLEQKFVNLLHQAQRQIHLSTLETIWTLLQRYADQFVQSAPVLQGEISKQISENDIQRSQWAIKCSTCLMQLNPQMIQNQKVLENCILLSASQQIQNHQIVQDLELLFKQATSLKIINQQIIDKLIDQVQLSTRSSAKMAAIIISQNQLLTQEYVQKLMNCLQASQKEQDNILIKATLCLGEIGSTQDLSGQKGIIEIISNLFQNQDDQVRQAASISLGSISIGNTNFFLDHVFKLIQKSDIQEKYMYLSTIREIIFIKPECLRNYLEFLMPLYISQASNQNEQIRNIVAESIGKLFIVHPQPLQQTLNQALASNDLLCLATCTKSFKYSAYRNKDAESFRFFIHSLVNLIKHYDLDVKQAALEAVGMIASNDHLNILLKDGVEQIVALALKETPIKKELQTVIDLGPFKHIVDNGEPIRKAAFTLLQNITEKFQFNQSQVVEAVINAFLDTNEDVQLLCLGFMSKQIQICPMIVLANLDNIIKQFNDMYSKMANNLKQNTHAERHLNLMRGILRVTEALQRNPEVMANPSFQQWFSMCVLENVDIPLIRELYEKIASSSANFMI